MNDLSRRLKYVSWAAQKRLSDKDHYCPACGAKASYVRRKFLVLSLMECGTCGLRFRFPKDDAAITEYYQTSYSEDYPAQLPPAVEALSDLTSSGVLDHPANNYAQYIEVLNALGLKAGDPILDFGCSWGYGSWQFRQAGFRVYSIEVSKMRAEYARNSMGCSVVEDVSQIPEPVKCFFSSHVIEHLPDPSLIWREAAKILRPNGKIVIFCPNGEPSREAVIGRKRYDYLWPQVHPMVITPKFLRSAGAKVGFCCRFYSDPFDLPAIANSVEAQTLFGDELLLVAERCAQ